MKKRNRITTKHSCNVTLEEAKKLLELLCKKDIEIPNKPIIFSKILKGLTDV